MIRTCHIQYDFDKPGDGNDDTPFFINLDETQDSIKEFRVQQNQDKTYTVINDGENKEKDSFKQITDRVYEAHLNSDTFQFQVEQENLTGSINQRSLQWTSVATTPEWYVLGDDMGSIHVYDKLWRKKRVMEQAHMDGITSLRCFPSGSVLLSSSNDMSIKLWSLVDGSNPRTFTGHTSKVTDTTLIERGRNFASCGHDGTIRLWECGSGKNIHTFTRKENPHDAVNSMALLTRKNDKSQEQQQQQQQQQQESELEFGTSGKHILAGHESGVMTLHDLYTKKEEIQLPNEFMSSCNTVVSSLSNEHCIFAGYDNGTLAEWDLRLPEKSVSHIELTGTMNPINTIHLAPSSTTPNWLYVSCGLDTSLRTPLNSSGSLPSMPGTSPPLVPQFLVSDDYQVSQFIDLPTCNVNNVQDGQNIEEGNILTVGNRGFVSVY